MNARKKNSQKALQGQQSISSFFGKTDSKKSKLALKRPDKTDVNQSPEISKLKITEETSSGDSSKRKLSGDSEIQLENEGEIPKRLKFSKSVENNVVPDVDEVDKCNIFINEVLSDAIEDKIGNVEKDNVNENQSEGLDELFSDNWDDFDINSSENSSEGLDLSIWQRCEVVDLAKTNNHSLEVTVKSFGNNCKKAKCLINGCWTRTNINQGDTLSLIASQSAESSDFIIDDNNGMLVHWPDTLVSGTAVVGSVFCERKAILSDRFKGIDGGNEHLVIGSLVHELFQSTLKNQITDMEEIRSECRKLLEKPDTIYMMYDAGMHKTETMVEMMKFVPQISHFASKYVENGQNKNPKYKNKASVAENSEWDGTIDKIVDIEENIWSPRLGLKGKVDVSVEVTIHDRQSNKLLKKYMPLELKTGKQSGSVEHRGQVILYTMLMTAIAENPVEDEVKEGILLYLRDTIGIHEISSGHAEKRDLLMLRNQLAYYLATNSNKKKLLGSGNDIPTIELPEPINHHSACGKCPYLSLCWIHLSKDPNANLSDSHNLWNLKLKAMGYLESSHIDYFLHWCRLVALEESERQQTTRLKDMWTRTPEQRQNDGKALIDMILSGKIVHYGNHYEHVFKRNNSIGPSITAFSLQIGDTIVVSTKNRIAISMGFISEIEDKSITLQLERDLSKRNKPDTVFNLDFYESQSGMSYNLTNLGVLMDDNPVANKLRSLIIDKQAATFYEKLPREVADKGKEIIKSLNVVQKRAILKALTANDYILIKGMPGTGKTQTIVALIELLAALGKSILVTSQTHSAVDNVLVRLKNKNLNILRLGAIKRIHPEIVQYSEFTLMKTVKSPKELEELYNKANIVGVTCLGSNHAVLTKRTFDVCIVDESTQVLQCSVLRPLFAAKKFILVGDPDQLPPIVRSNKARDLGMEECLFTRLDGTPATLCLNLQYRMNSSITRLANLLTYKGMLQCGNETVEKSTIGRDNSKMKRQEPWIHSCLSSKLADSVVAIDTGNTLQMIKNYNVDFMSSEEQNMENNCHNPCEAALVLNIIAQLMKGGLKAEDIGVIAPYRLQVALIKKSLAKCHTSSLRRADSGISEDVLPPNIGDIEVNTVDQYQGRDKDVIIYSCTRTSSSAKEENRSREILEDKRRLTVAITRAKFKLIIIGDVKTLQSYKPFEQLFRELISDEEVKKKSRWNSFISLPDNEFNWDSCLSIL